MPRCWFGEGRACWGKASSCPGWRGSFLTGVTVLEGLEWPLTTRFGVGLSGNRTWLGGLVWCWFGEGRACWEEASSCPGWSGSFLAGVVLLEGLDESESLRGLVQAKLLAQVSGLKRRSLLVGWFGLGAEVGIVLVEVYLVEG